MDQGSSGTLIAQAPKNEPLLPSESAPDEQLAQPAPAKELESEFCHILRLRPQSAMINPRARLESPAPLPEAMAKGNPWHQEARTGGLIASGQVLKMLSREMNELRPSQRSPPAAVPPPPMPPAAAMRSAQLAQAQSGAADQLSCFVAPEVAGSSDAKRKGSRRRRVAAWLTPERDGPQGVDKQTAAGQKAGIEPTAVNGNFMALSKLDEVRRHGIQIKSPSGKVLWRVGSGGRIERSNDAGSAWILQSSPSTDEWLAGAAAPTQSAGS